MPWRRRPQQSRSPRPLPVPGRRRRGHDRPGGEADMIDLLVAGAGPAGLVTALYAARAGLDVTVVDPRFAGSEKPIDKACGEGLMPGAVTALAELGVDPPGRDFRGIGYIAGRHRAEAFFTSGP